MNVTCSFLLMALISVSAFGFSPYENRLMTGEPTRVGLIAAAKPGQAKDLEAALKALAGKDEVKALEAQNITNLSTYKQVLAGKTWIMVYFDYTGKEYLEAVAGFEQVKAVQALKPYLDPHPRAARYETTWLQMEWMCYIRGTQEKGDPTDRIAMVTRIKPEKEQEYRILHQTVWPGVVDQMTRSHTRNFSIFFVEIGEELYEFFYMESLSTDPEKDGEMNNSDPFNQRWWKITDACQDPLPGASGVWLMMDKITK